MTAMRRSLHPPRRRIRPHVRSARCPFPRAAHFSCTTTARVAAAVKAAAAAARAVARVVVKAARIKRSRRTTRCGATINLRS